MFRAFTRSYLRARSRSSRPPPSRIPPLLARRRLLLLLSIASAAAAAALAALPAHTAPPRPPRTPPAMSPPGAPAAALPGRPGSLTPDEEAKLKLLWHATLQVFGVVPPAAAAPSTTPPSADPDSPPVSPDSRKKKQKPFGRFLSRRGRPDKDDPAPTTTTTAAAAPAPDDDKYNQTHEFRAALASQTPAELRAAFWGMVKCDNPDSLLLRFLRARKWDVDKALVMMVATMNWRSKVLNVQDIVEKGEAGYAADADQGFIKQLRMGKSFLHGTDKDGRPICLVRVRLHKQADQSEEALERYTVYIMETARLMLRDPVDTAAVVFDMSGFSMANMVPPLLPPPLCATWTNTSRTTHR